MLKMPKNYCNRCGVEIILDRYYNLNFVCDDCDIKEEKSEKLKNVKFKLLDTFAVPNSKDSRFLTADEVISEIKAIKSYSFPVKYLRRKDKSLLGNDVYAIVQVWGEI